MKRLIAALFLGASVLTSSSSTWSQEAPATSPAMRPMEKKAKVALIKLSDTLVERPGGFALSLSALTTSGGKPPALSDLIHTLNEAAKDNSLDGLFLDLSYFTLTLNQAQEIGSLLTKCRTAGKRVAIYSADYDTATYVLATYADKIIMPEQGDVLIPGAGLQMVFFAGTLEKLNMSADFVQVGKFKGAEEPFTRKSASPEYKQQIEKLVDGMYTQIISTIADNRKNLTEDQVKKDIDEGLFSGKQAKTAGLIDETMPRNQVDSWLEKQFKPGGITLVEDYGQPKKKSLDLSSPFAIFSLLGDSGPTKSHDPAIAVLYANGEISPDSAGSEDATEGVTPAMIRKAVKVALDDDLVKAIVLRVDSPGGSASASDEIWSILKEADKKKPVTVSMGRVAASGGYYISCAGRSIVADPATITGSIGVVGGKVVIKGALDWAGINIEPIDKGAHAEMLSMLRPFSDEERAFVKKSMEEVYGVFTSRVTAARGAKVAQLEEVAQGRLFTGAQAKAAGLVDDVATLDDAIKSAAKTAGISAKYQVMILPEAKSLGDILRDGILSDVKAPLVVGLKMDAATALISSLPTDIQTPTLRAMHMLQTLQNERVLVEMPAGLIEMHPAHR